MPGAALADPIVAVCDPGPTPIPSHIDNDDDDDDDEDDRDDDDGCVGGAARCCTLNDAAALDLRVSESIESRMEA